MSFGYTSSSTTFNAGTDGGKPMIFWQQQNLAGQKKKKYGYKEKSLKHPLRKTEPPPPLKEPKSRPPPSKPGLNASKKPGTDKAGATHKPSGKGQGKDAKPTDPNSVVLTQKQFDAILETIGQLSLEAETKVVAPSGGNRPVDNGTEAVGSNHSNPAEYVPGLGNPAQVSSVNVAPGRTESHPPPAQPPAQLPVQTPTQPPVPPPQPPPQQQQQVQPPTEPYAPQQSSVKSPVAALLAMPPAHLTKAERKRLQWDAERAQAKKDEDWNPWGRPGAGAPVKDSQGNAMTDYTTRQSVMVRQSLEQARQSTEYQPSSLPNHTQTQYPNNPHPQPPQQQQQQQQLAPSTTSYNDLLPHQRARLEAEAAAAVTQKQASALPGDAQPQQPQQPQHPQQPQQPQYSTSGVGAVKSPPPPAAIRSSFAVGDVAPDELRFESAKERQKREWLLELEKQRTEQRERKLRERNSLRGAAPEQAPSTWADKLTHGYQPKPLPEQSPVGAADSQGPRVNSAPIANAAVTPRIETSSGVNLPSMNPVTPTPSTFIRGQNVPLDPTTLKEMEEKRRKQQEYQDYIKQQMEEKAQLKRAERDMKIREEQEEERKLAQQRDGNQTHQEQQRNKDKQEEEKRRTEAMKAAMDLAHDQAELEKHQRRLHKLQQGGHDVSHLTSNFEAKHTPRGLLSHRGQPSAEPPTHTPFYNHTTAEPTAVEPTHVPGLDLSPTGHTQRYTPSHTEMQMSYRNTMVADSVDRKEFGMQTEIPSEEQYVPIAREVTEANIEYNGPFKKKVRVKSAQKEGKTQQGKASSAGSKNGRRGKVTERPRWGYQNPVKKKPVKQSEKDPFYELKKQRNEHAKEERQKTLLAMSEKQSPRTAHTDTVSSRARSRSRERNPTTDSRNHPKSILSTSKVANPSPTGHYDYDHHARNSHRDGRSSRNLQRESPGTFQPRASSPPIPTLLNKQATERESPSVNQHRTASPPVPTIKHRLDVNYDLDAHNFEPQSHGSQPRVESRAKYTDKDPINAPVHNGDFVPFIRTNDLLDPAKAHEPMPVSREPTTVTRGRQAYVQEHNPAKYGKPMENFRDPMDAIAVKNDPILQPGLVKDHPTTRQGRILQQLSDLRRGLMQKQRELEVGLTPTDNLQAGVA